MTKGVPDSLGVRLNDRAVGSLTRLVNETIVFAFDPSYAEDLQRPILSLSYKTASGHLHIDQARTGTKLGPFFSNLLPEGHLRDYLAKKLRVGTHREFNLLAGLGQDLPGAVIVEPMGELSKAQDSEVFQNNNTDSPLLRFSLAGVQLKFSAIAESKGTFTVPAGGAGGSWIVKLPSERHFQIPESEYSMLLLASLCGIEVPEFKLIPTSSIEGLPAEFRNLVADSLAVKCFDRTDSGGRIHMEDFAQVYNIYPQDKYAKAGYGHIGQVLWAEAGEDSYTEFVKRLVFTVAIGNGDMHLKNWSLLFRDPTRPVLSPAYDFVPSIAYVENDSLALNLGGTKDFAEVTIDRFRKMAVQAKASEKLTATIVTESIDRIYSVWKEHRFQLRLPADVRQEIDKHISKLSIFKSQLIAHPERASDSLPRLKNIAIKSVEYDPIIHDNTMILEAPIGTTTAVRAPERMEPDLIKEAAQKGLLVELGEGPCRVYVGEKLYRQWRLLQYITIEPSFHRTMNRGIGEWTGNIETISSEYSAAAWQKIVSAHQRQSMEEFDVVNDDGSIRTFKARVLSIRDIKREPKTDSTEAAVELNIQDEETILQPFVGISHLMSDFEIHELEHAVETALQEKQWQTGIFSEARRIRARKEVKYKKRHTVKLELEIIFRQDERKTDLLIKVTDIDKILGTAAVNGEAREVRQNILEYLPGPD